jgi:hypothetical protein
VGGGGGESKLAFCGCGSGYGGMPKQIVVDLALLGVGGQVRSCYCLPPSWLGREQLCASGDGIVGAVIVFGQGSEQTYRHLCRVTLDVALSGMRCLTTSSRLGAFCQPKTRRRGHRTDWRRKSNMLVVDECLFSTRFMLGRYISAI